MSARSRSRATRDMPEAAAQDMAERAGILSLNVARTAATTTCALRIELGHARLERAQAARISAGSLVELQSAVDDQVEIYVGGDLVALGQLVELDGRLAVRVCQCTRVPRVA